MTKYEKLYRDIVIDGKNNISFADMDYFVRHTGFSCRIKGDHHFYRMDGIPEAVNLQPDKGMAKPYQVKQIRSIVKKYKIGGIEDE